MKPRVVLDTNVLVSALLTRHVANAAVLDLIVQGSIQPCVSQPILIEYQAVLSDPKFQFDQTATASLIRLLSAVGLLVRPSQRLAVSPHEGDNRFLECAEAAEAEFVITGNTRHYPKQYKRTRVVNAREFLNVRRL